MTFDLFFLLRDSENDLFRDKPVLFFVYHEMLRVPFEINRAMSKYTILTKNGRLIPTVKRGKEIKQP